MTPSYGYLFQEAKTNTETRLKEPTSFNSKAFESTVKNIQSNDTTKVGIIAGGGALHDQLTETKICWKDKLNHIKNKLTAEKFGALNINATLIDNNDDHSANDSDCEPL